MSEILSKSEAKQRAVDGLVLTAGRVLKAFKSGTNPSFDQLEKFESALFPFTHDKICGHRIVEECDCAEINNKKADTDTGGKR